VVAAQIQLHCCAPLTAVTHPPLSPQRAASVFGHRVLTAVAVREQVNRCSMSRARWSTALGRGTHGGFVVGRAGQGLLRTPLRRVRRSLAPRCRFSRPLVDSNTPTPHRFHGASTARRRATLECTRCSGGGSARRVGRDAPSVPKPQQCSAGGQQCTAREAQCARAVEESPPCTTARARTQPTDSALPFCCVVPPGACLPSSSPLGGSTAGTPTIAIASPGFRVSHSGTTVDGPRPVGRYAGRPRGGVGRSCLAW
jgi:hypothetical protein